MYYLQIKLNDYASYVLSNYWQKLKDDMLLDLTVLQKRIFDDLFPPSVLVNRKEPTKEEQALINVLVEIVCRIAKRMQKILTNAVGVPLGSMKFAMLPCKSRPAADGVVTDYCVEVFGNKDRNLGCVVMSNIRVPSIQRQCCDEAHLSIEEKYRFGLLAKPKTDSMELFF